ncbi:LTA synthase family protein [Clostridium sp. Marseille-P2415]|uniref:LTA synthase family protein n=1 Tax=Clostridium sp. Marseille-P2415 TaxID=1805471 RepID=UPI001F308CF4|nr:LTA synthase family protein [Clostridium sp. Marseille-P2415]
MTKQRLLKWCKTAGNFITGTILLLIPCISFLLFEYVTGNLAAIPLSKAILNISWVYILYLVAFAVSGSTRIAIPVVSVLLYAVSVAEYLVVGFRDRPIMFWDVLAFQTAMSVAGNYEFVLTEEMYLSCLAVQAICLFALIFPKRVKGKKMRLFFAGGSAGVVISFGLWFYTYLIPYMGLGINMWAVNETYQEYGYVLSTAVSCSYAVKKKPEGYSLSKVEQIYDSIREENQVLTASAGDVDAEGENTVSPVNIICIMNESLSDLKAAGEFETNREYFPFLNSLKENTVKGSLCVPVFGSMTSNSEFEFLTGDSIALLPANSIAYQFNVKPNTYSLVSTLKSQGYETVAMHPYPKENWNREECYRNMGIDEFFDIEEYEDREQLRDYVSDRADYGKLIEKVESKEDPTDKLFLFNVTMQNHGGYESQYDNFNQEVWLTGDLKGKYPKADQYLSLMKRSDEALEYLISYFEQSTEPTMIVLFGDHQPSVEDEFFDEIAGVPSSEVSNKDRLMWYQTPFIIWTNYETQPEEKGKMGAIYLSSELLKRARLEMTPFQKFLLSMEETFPVVHPIGCYNKAGTYYTWEALEEEGSPYRGLIKDYEYLVYNHIFDGKKYKEMFTLGIGN